MLEEELSMDKSNNKLPITPGTIENPGIKKKYLIIALVVFFILTIAVVVSIVSYDRIKEILFPSSQQEESQPDLAQELQETLASEIGTLRGYEVELQEQASIGIFWARPHPGEAIWNEVEKTPGNYEWKRLDDLIQAMHSLSIHPLITIWPYADWDQGLCHSDLPATPDPFGGVLPKRKGIPCDWGSYQEFLSALVERYDGDGKEDMPGLLFPVNYFEVGNEPEMQEGNNTFFQGTPEEYALLLQKSAEAIRQASSEAEILHAGIASDASFSEEFWNGVFSQEGIGDSFDIANIHDLARSEDGNVGFMKSLLQENNIPDKPVWVTEFILLGGPGGNRAQVDVSELEERIDSAFSAGAEKIFLLLPPSREMDEELIEILKEIVDGGE